MTSTLFLIEAIYSNIFRCSYLRNEKYFLNFFLNFLNLDTILKIFKKEMTLRADVFLDLRTRKNRTKESCVRRTFHKWHGKRAERLWTKTLVKSERQHLYHIYWSLWSQFKLKKSLWVISKILGLFVSPLTADDKYSLFNRGNLLQHVLIQLSQKPKTFSEFFLHLLNLDWTLKIFEK